MRWNYPTSIRFGAGIIKELPDACRELGMNKPLIVTDPGLAELPLMMRIRTRLAYVDLQTRVFSKVSKNPTGEDVMAGVDAYTAGGHDGVIAVGGGVGMDVGKAVALMIGQTRPLWEFEDVDDWWTRVDEDRMAPCVAVPTTSGTGSEVGRASVIVDSATHTKRIIFHPKMLPARVVADPELTFGLPPEITAAVGMDALSHNLEAFCVDAYHPMADGIAMEGIRLISESLEDAVEEPENVEARSNMMVASSMGATAFQKGLGAMHAVAHPIGAVHDTHHGLTNAVLMPYVMRFNRKVIDEKMTRLARLLGLRKPGFSAMLRHVVELRSSIGIPDTLADLGLKEEDLDVLVPMALADPSAGGNPRLMDADNTRTLLHDAWSGKL